MTTTPKKLPVLTIVGVLLPVICAVGANILTSGNANSGGWGLGEIFAFVFLIGVGGALGAVCSVLALRRGERWRPLQVLVLLANGAVALFVGVLVLRPRHDPIPVGEAAYLRLAPVAERMRPEVIVLAYPVLPDSGTGQRLPIGQRDSSGVVTSVRMAEIYAPLRRREVRLGLDAVDGRWTVRRDLDHIAKIPWWEWRRAVYLEVRLNVMDFGVPIGVADREFWPLHKPR